jgi:hypothetical protein
MISGLLLIVLACVYFTVSVQALSTPRICARFTGKLIPRSAREKGFQLSSSGGDFISDVGALSGAVSAIVAAFPGVSKALEKLKRNLPATKHPFPVVKNYISRPSLESKIH